MNPGPRRAILSNLRLFYEISAIRSSVKSLYGPKFEQSEEELKKIHLRLAPSLKPKIHSRVLGIFIDPHL